MKVSFLAPSILYHLFVSQIRHFAVNPPCFDPIHCYLWLLCDPESLEKVAAAGYVEPLSTVSAGTLVEGRVTGVPAQVDLDGHDGRKWKWIRFL